MSSAPSDERSGLSFVLVIVRPFSVNKYRFTRNAHVSDIYTRPMSVQAEDSRSCSFLSSLGYNGSLVTQPFDDLLLSTAPVDPGRVFHPTFPSWVCWIKNLYIHQHSPTLFSSTLKLWQYISPKRLQSCPHPQGARTHEQKQYQKRITMKSFTPHTVNI
jgi:hypothetical protein